LIDTNCREADRQDDHSTREKEGREKGGGKGGREKFWEIKISVWGYRCVHIYSEEAQRSRQHDVQLPYTAVCLYHRITRTCKMTKLAS